MPLKNRAPALAAAGSGRLFARQRNVPTIAPEEQRAKVLRDLRLRRAASRADALGERVSVELTLALVEITSDRGAAAALLERFAGIDPDLLRAVGADRPLPSPIRVVWP
jgi:hypothetical protein